MCLSGSDPLKRDSEEPRKIIHMGISSDQGGNPVPLSTEGPPEIVSDP